MSGNHVASFNAYYVPTMMLNCVTHPSSVFSDEMDQEVLGAIAKFMDENKVSYTWKKVW